VLAEGQDRGTQGGAHLEPVLLIMWEGAEQTGPQNSSIWCVPPPTPKLGVFIFRACGLVLHVGGGQRGEGKVRWPGDLVPPQFDGAERDGALCLAWFCLLGAARQGCLGVLPKKLRF
jgi:hypothetical protein